MDTPIGIYTQREIDIEVIGNIICDKTKEIEKDESYIRWMITQLGCPYII